VIGTLAQLEAWWQRRGAFARPGVTTMIFSTRVEVRRMFGIPIAAITMAGVISLLDNAIARRDHLQVGVVNVAKIVNMRHDQALRQSVLSSDIILADGMAVVWASRLLGCRLPERVAGIDLMMALLARADQRGYRVYCLGATSEVVEKVAVRIPRDFPGAHLVGYHTGYFGQDDEHVVAEEIAAARPDILFVAMTSPRKEYFLARWSQQIQVPVSHGVGGSFDVLAGKVRRAPELWQRLGLEWLYRVKQEPRRLWKRYLITNTLFCAMFVSEFLHRLHEQRPHARD